MIRSRDLARWLKFDRRAEFALEYGIKEFSRVQVRFLMLNTMCLTSLHNIQQDLINFIPVFSSLLMQVIFFLLLEINCTEFRHALFLRERDLYTRIQW